MTLIDRYLQEVGRHLPRSRRDDILAELRSSLLDQLEDLAADRPTEEDIVRLLQDMSPPRDVAASYYPEGQYLIGPTLFPLFKMVASIAVLASLGAQLVAWLVAVVIGGEALAFTDSFWGLLNTIPVTLGMVVIIFAVLQRLEVRPTVTAKAWDPRSLPQPVSGKPVKRGERIVGLVFGVVFLGLFAAYPDRIGVYNLTDGSFWGNPVLVDYLIWISLSLILGIGVDVYLLWRGIWDTVGRLAKIGANVFSIFVLSLLFQAHNAWLADRGLGNVLETLGQLGDNGQLLTQIVGMQLFRMGMAIALVAVTIETVVMAARLIYNMVSSNENITPLVVGKG